MKLYHSLDITARSVAVCACPQLVILCDVMIAPRPQKELLELSGTHGAQKVSSYPFCHIIVTKYRICNQDQVQNYPPY